MQVSLLMKIKTMDFIKNVILIVGIFLSTAAFLNSVQFIILGTVKEIKLLLENRKRSLMWSRNEMRV